MKDFHATSGLLLGMVFAVLAQQIATYSMNETCAYIKEGFIANPNDCKGYGYCQNGTLIFNGSCPADYIYNSDDGTCDYPKRFQCRVANVDSICKYNKDTEIFPDPDNCSRYCQCQNGIAVCNTCPTYQVFDSVNTRCIWRPTDYEYTCLSDSVCRLIKNTVFAEDPRKCGKYVFCMNGKANPGECNTGFFNPKLGGCQPGEASCENSTEMNNEPCKNYNGDKKQVQYLSDGKTCYGYYGCTSTSDKPTRGSCPRNLHFNPEKQECVTPYTYKCPYDRCGNMDQQFVGAIDYECKHYLYCRNQTAVNPNNNYEGTPCQNNLYFNEFTGTCGKDPTIGNTNYKLCATTTD